MRVKSLNLSLIPTVISSSSTSRASAAGSSSPGQVTAFGHATCAPDKLWGWQNTGGAHTVFEIHLHLVLISSPPQVPISRFVQWLKGGTAHVGARLFLADLWPEQGLQAVNRATAGVAVRGIGLTIIPQQREPGLFACDTRR